MKVISFSLWGRDETYTIGAIKNAELALTVYPEWRCRFYVGASVPSKIIKKLKSFEHCDVVLMEEDGDWNAMLWRFLPAGEEGVDVMISRDCDSRLNSREKAAVDEWLKSDKGFHIMRDHPYHTTEILGGMWGVKSGILTDMSYHIDKFTKGNYWQVDQDFLKQVVHPNISFDCMVHDPFFEKQPFPKKRKGNLFVGQAFDKNDRPLHPEHMGEL